LIHALIAEINKKRVERQLKIREETMLNKKYIFLFLFSCISSLLLNGCNKTPPKKSFVTFQFDDVFITQYTAAKPLFDSKGIKASIMVTTENVGKSKYYMSWNQLTEMYNEGWEIGAHTVNHIDLRSANEESIRYELSQGKAVLEVHGFQNVNNFAYPYNYYDLDVLYVISDYYRSARTSVAQTGFFVNPTNIHPYELSAYEARLNIDNVANAYTYVNKAQKEGRWLIYILHEFSDNGITNNTASKEITDIKALEMLIDYIQDRNIPIVTTEQALNYYIGFE
jgi:peptidoglycan/xylan/chitin deacetylase (PgdA/CDA1 family)